MSVSFRKEWCWWHNNNMVICSWILKSSRVVFATLSALIGMEYSSVRTKWSPLNTKAKFWSLKQICNHQVSSHNLTWNYLMSASYLAVPVPKGISRFQSFTIRLIAVNTTCLPESSSLVPRMKVPQKRRLLCPFGYHRVVVSFFSLLVDSLGESTWDWLTGGFYA